MKALAKIENMTALEVYTCGAVEKLITDIETEARALVPDTETSKGRAEIRTRAANIASGKVTLEKLGKGLKTGIISKYDKEVKAIDAERTLIKTRMDALKIEVRQPLTEWEDEQKAKADAEKLAKELADCHDQALIENDLFDREQVIKKQEAENKRIEAKRIADEQAEQQRVAIAKHEQQIADDASEQARIDVENKAARQVAEAKAAEERAKREKVDGIRRAKEAADRKEAKRLADIKATENEAKQKAENKEHCRGINNEILESLIDCNIGISIEFGRSIIEVLAKRQVNHVRINYRGDWKC